MNAVEFNFNSKPLFLALECSTRNCSVALFEQNRLLECIEDAPESFVHSEKLHDFIEEIFRKSNCKISELSAVGVGIGPGSYTGLRIGLSSAKGICYALEIPLVGVSSLEILYQTLRLSEIESKTEAAARYFPMLDARRMEVYTAEFDARGQRSSPDRPMILTEEVPAHPGRCFGDGSFKAQALLEEKGHQVLNGPLPSARGMGDAIFSRWKAGDFEDLRALNPSYLKEFQAGKVSTEISEEYRDSISP